MPNAGTYERHDDLCADLPQNAVGRIYRFRYALINLILKDFKVRYRNMSLGVLWSVINPLVMLGVLIIVFSYIHPARHAHFFPVFLLTGMITYNFFSLSLPPATMSVIDNASLVKKVIFPRELIPISAVLSQLIHVGIQFVLLCFFLLIFSVPIHLTALWVPVIYLVLLVFILGMAFACSALNVFYRDVLYVVQSGLTVLFWLTPIFYDLAQVKLNLPPPLYMVYILNPLSGCIDAMRRVLLRGENPDPQAFGFAAGVAVVTCLAGYAIYRKRQDYFADKM